MPLINITTDLKNIKFSETGTKKPFITKDINNPPPYNSISSQITKRVDDVSRLTQMFVSNAGVRFIANEQILSADNYKNQFDKHKDAGRTTAGALLRTAGSAVLDTGKTVASLIAQAGLSGTGYHEIRGFKPASVYLEGAEQANLVGDFLPEIFGNLDPQINAPAQVLEGERVYADNRGEEGYTGPIKSNLQGRESLDQPTGSLADDAKIQESTILAQDGGQIIPDNLGEESFEPKIPTTKLEETGSFSRKDSLEVDAQITGSTALAKDGGNIIPDNTGVDTFQPKIPTTKADSTGSLSRHDYSKEGVSGSHANSIEFIKKGGTGYTKKDQDNANFAKEGVSIIPDNRTNGFDEEYHWSDITFSNKTTKESDEYFGKMIDSRAVSGSSVEKDAYLPKTRGTKITNVSSSRASLDARFGNQIIPDNIGNPEYSASVETQKLNQQTLPGNIETGSNEIKSNQDLGNVGPSTSGRHEPTVGTEGDVVDFQTKLGSFTDTVRIDPDSVEPFDNNDPDDPIKISQDNGSGGRTTRLIDFRKVRKAGRVAGVQKMGEVEGEDGFVSKTKVYYEGTYDSISMEQKYGIGNPGKAQDEYDLKAASKVEKRDKINMLDVGESPSEFTDMIDFNFTSVIAGFSFDQGTILNFRAFLNSFSDDYSGDWSGVKYIGRAEELQAYQGFSRTMQFDFTAAAMTKEELKPIYNKLNKLAGMTAPNYSDNRFQQGTYSLITIGDYVNRLPVVFTGVGFSWEVNTPWEIDSLNEGLLKVPHSLSVSCNVTVLHNFAPTHDSRFIGYKAGQDT